MRTIFVVLLLLETSPNLETLDVHCYDDYQADKAAIKAMLVNRVGDFGLAPGISGCFTLFQTTFAITSAFSPASLGTLLHAFAEMFLYTLFVFLADDPYVTNSNLGELLKVKSQEGVRVLLLVWDDPTSTSILGYKTEGVMNTGDDETRRCFKHSSVKVLLCPRIAVKGSWAKKQVERIPDIIGISDATSITEGDTESWNVFRSIDSNSVKGFPKNLREASDKSTRGTLEQCFEHLESLECVRRVKWMGELNWRQFEANEISPMRGHLLKYPHLIAEMQAQLAVVAEKVTRGWRFGQNLLATG
ncbi:phospholipase d gamma 1 [Phtheirospermum japonicum]|uniref:Phospholipase d gamma 1 n=1 Tax=Phtheirospermum japonicum TaxID=374723 RepID=A0A830DGW9_9LAMI|nr:phospholipase d gamma 1 [Phtheirospermum japonicum]